MLIDIGPATLVLKGEKGGKDHSFDRTAVTARVEWTLAQIKECLPILKQKASLIRKTAYLPPAARAMVEGVKEIDPTSLTPMAAVAGAVAEELLDFLKGEGLEFLSVNNGGDIAVCSHRPKPVAIGIGDIRSGGLNRHVLRIEGLKEFGVATSGFGGRSFTLGLADMVSVIARSAPVADAAATFICNHTNIEHASVVRRKAAEIDPSTDIPEEMVTVRIGELSPEAVREALAKGKEAAERLKIERRIHDAVIILRGEAVTTIEPGGNIILEVTHGNSQDRHGGGGYLLRGRKEGRKADPESGGPGGNQESLFRQV